MITNYCLHLRYLHIVTLIIMGFFKKILGSSPSDFAKEESGYNYQKEETKRLNEKLHDLQDLLPDFCRDFFRGVADTLQIKSRIAYALTF